MEMEDGFEVLFEGKVVQGRLKVLDDDWENFIFIEVDLSFLMQIEKITFCWLTDAPLVVIL